MSDYDRDSWEARWSQALDTHGDRVAQRPPNAHLTAEIGDLRPGRALDAGCGHGAEALWLAARGWRVTGVDFAATALSLCPVVSRGHGRRRRRAHRLGRGRSRDLDAAARKRMTWWFALYVHVAGSVEEFVQRMAAGVARGGTLFLVGHRPVDPATGAATAAAGQVQVSVEAVLAALDPGEWQPIVAEERRRPWPRHRRRCRDRARRRS